MRDVEHIYMNVPRWTSRKIEEGTPWMDIATELESMLSQLDSLLGEFGGIGFFSQLGTLSNVTDEINTMRNARKYLHEEIVRLVDRPLEECFTRAVEALETIDFDKIRVENKAGLVINNTETGGQSHISRNKEDYSLLDVLMGNVPELNKCVGYNQKIDGFREILEEMGGFTLAELQEKSSKTGDENSKNKKDFWDRIGDNIDNLLTYHNFTQADNPTGNLPLESILEYVGNITIDIIGKVKIKTEKNSLEKIDIRQDNIKAETYYIDKYVNIETLKTINNRWNLDTLEATYGDDCMERLKEYMYEYGITDEVSILMFLCTIGVESGYGAYILEERDKNNFGDIKSYSFNTKGAGLIQITGATQIAFLCYEKEELLKDGDDEKAAEIQKYIDGFYNKGSKVENEYNVAQYIADNYAIEASTWFWAKNSCKEFYLNDFIIENKNGNLFNLFLVSQYYVNATEFKKETLEFFVHSNVKCNVQYYPGEENCKVNEICLNLNEKPQNHSTDYCLTFVDGDIEKHSYGPRNWKERLADWNCAQNLMEE